MQESGTVDRLPKSDGVENMMRVHKSINIDDVLTATKWLNAIKNHFDWNKIPVEIFSSHKCLTDLEC